MQVTVQGSALHLTCGLVVPHHAVPIGREISGGIQAYGLPTTLVVVEEEAGRTGWGMALFPVGRHIQSRAGDKTAQCRVRMTRIVYLSFAQPDAVGL